jgi:hypothetical protein
MISIKVLVLTLPVRRFTVCEIVLIEDRGKLP